jgi:hypothetical protein
MFVRFRAKGKRLVVDLVETRRNGRKVRCEHIARLGSLALPEPFPPDLRVCFWRDLKNRWRDLVDRLGNRVSAENRKKALRQIAARIPKPDELEERLVRAAPIKRQAEFYERDNKERGESMEKHIADLRAEHQELLDATGQALVAARENYVRAIQGKIEPDRVDALAQEGDSAVLQLLAARAGGPAFWFRAVQAQKRKLYPPPRKTPKDG